MLFKIFSKSLFQVAVIRGIGNREEKYVLKNCFKKYFFSSSNKMFNWEARPKNDQIPKKASKETKFN